MDFHVWAKLDTDGRIQSVQSSCTQSPQRHSPVWPFVPTEACTSGEAQPSNDNSEKVVPYVEKKELVYKLDAKVDEMSVIMTQLAELTKRVKVQEKLITQYEEKLSRKQKQLQALVKENERLRTERQCTRKTRSLDSFSENSSTIPKCFGSSIQDFKMVCNLENSGRSSSWPRDNSFRTGRFDDTIKAKGKRRSRENEDFDDVDDAGPSLPCDDLVKSAVRPSSLNLDFGICGSLSGTDVDVEGHFNIRHSSIRNGYSYVRKQEQLVLQSTDLQQHKLLMAEENEVDKEEKLENNKKKNSDMNPPADVCPMGDSVYSFSKDVNKNIWIENTDTEDTQKTYIENEAIHSTWKDIQNGNLIIEPGDTEDTVTRRHVLPDGYLQPMGCTNDYIDLAISEENFPRNKETPPLPERSVRFDSKESKGSFKFDNQDVKGSVRFDNLKSNDSNSLDRHHSSSSSSSTNSDKSPVFGVYPRRTSFPVSPNTRTQLAQTRSVFSLELPLQGTSSLSDARSPSNDLRKDDNLNKVFKDMRTTMEWNKAKKKLISKSNDNTVDKVELRLRSTVQAVYEAYSILHAEKGARLKKYAKEKVIERVKGKISKCHADTNASEEFIKKCLDLVISNYPC